MPELFFLMLSFVCLEDFILSFTTCRIKNKLISSLLKVKHKACLFSIVSNIKQIRWALCTPTNWPFFFSACLCFYVPLCSPMNGSLDLMCEIHLLCHLANILLIEW
jgi:hypothetical protein